MPLPLQLPELQFIDADGHPYAGGTLQTLVPGTTTPKDTWIDHDGSALNTNPIVLNSAGRCTCFGDGDYRVILRDVNGNLVYDAWTTSIVSDAMQPVVAAPTIAEAQRLLGIVDSTAALNAEIARAEAAEATLTTNLNNEISRATAAETSLRNDLNAEIARAEAAEAALSAQIAGQPKTGTSFTDTSGHQRVTYDTAFPTGTLAVAVTHLGSDLSAQWFTVTYDAAGFDVWCSIPLADDAVHPSTSSFCWIAFGH